MSEEKLRDRVKTVAGVDYVTPSDCRRISREIFDLTSKQISESTLKRFFGLATTAHSFSKFTLTALQEYADSACIVTLKTEINSQQGKKQGSTDLTFNLIDGHLSVGDCVPEKALKKLQNTGNKEVPVKLKLSRKQVEDLFNPDDSSTEKMFSERHHQEGESAVAIKAGVASAVPALGSKK